MRYKTIPVDGVNIFYREAGDPSSPKLLLLHGFPSSSHQYRNLIPALAQRFHVIAPDYPGFGNSDMPEAEAFAYTFDNTACIVTAFCRKLGFTRFGLFVHDYGGPVGFRIIGENPDWMDWLIIQNANAYELGVASAWEALRSDYWVGRSAESEKAISGVLEPPAVKAIHTTGHRKPERINPDSWNMDSHFLERPGARQVQLDFFYDDRTNVELYPVWQRFLADRQPPTLIFWGQGDIFSTPAGGEAYLTAVPDAELHRLDSGRFAIEDCRDEIAGGMLSFYDRVVKV
jgi:pimeloyl-ACP methyl ester carboxylesterase